MKIYIITCHDVYNYGASLQAYALMKYLKSFNDVDVEIINYKPEYLSRHYYLWGINSKLKNKNTLLKLIYLLIKVPRRLLKRISRRKLSFDSFKRKYLHVTKRKYVSNEDLEKNLPIADLYIAGSDQIWNPILENGRDPAFFLAFVKESRKKVSYAASFAVDCLPDDVKDKISGNLNEFEHISVREISGLRILSSLGISNGICTVDPVFLLGRDEWEQLCSKEKKIHERFLFVYDFDQNPDMEIAVKRYAKANNLKIYSGLKCNYADKCFEDSGPIQFINLIKCADIVVSNSFHATAFSIIFHKTFFVFERQWEINTRMRDLLISLGGKTLENRIVKDITNDIKSIEWENVDNIMNAWILKSKEYLNNCLKG